MLSRNGMIYTTDPSLRERPETFNRVHVNIPAHVELLRMIHSVMPIDLFGKSVIGFEFVGVDGRCRNHMPFDMWHERHLLYIGHSCCHYSALSLHQLQ